MPSRAYNLVEELALLRTNDMQCDSCNKRNMERNGWIQEGCSGKSMPK